MVGRGQAVRQRVLVPLFGGSNPSARDLFIIAQNESNKKHIELQILKFYFQKLKGIYTLNQAH
jgi:hypothetical protein